jgi:hypothetical protein
LFVGRVAIGIGVGLLTANPLIGAMAAGAASNLFDYGARGLLNDEKLSWSGAFQSAAMGAAIGAGTLGVFKLAAFGARLIGRLVTTATSLVYRGGTALLSGAGRLAGSAISAGRTFFEQFPRLNPLNYRPRGFYSGIPIPIYLAPVNAAEEVFAQAVFAEITVGAEVIQGFRILGNKGLVGTVFNRNIFLLEAEQIGFSSPRALLRAFEEEAIAEGAHKISIIGYSVINQGLLSLNPAHLIKLGWSSELLNSQTLLLLKHLHY